jgi:signal transduction histidine kinase
MGTWRAFFVNDPDHAPFGRPWLRGITPMRLGLVAIVCLVFEFRQSAGTDWHIRSFFTFACLHFLASLPMLVLVNLADQRTAASTTRRRIVALSVAVISGAVIYAIAVFILFAVDADGLSELVSNPRSALQSLHVAYLVPFVGFFLRALLLGGLLAGILHFVTRESAVAAALRSTQLAGIALERQMAEAQVRVLHAQIEPHFLFNTLAHIKRLYETDPGEGRAMLHNLSYYLRTALPQMRNSRSTLARELALALAYLHVQQARMGERLELGIAVPEELQEAELPPMMLSTLVENAIKHGIAPLTQGGMIRIAATREGDLLRVTVADDGVGFQGLAGSGVGLANTRARLAALYGSRGRLTFAANPVRGFTVCIEVPYVTVPEDAAA